MAFLTQKGKTGSGPNANSYATAQEYRRGHIAYKAYCESTGGVSLISGDKLPEFALLKESIQVAWIAAADAIVADVHEEAGV